LIIFLILNKERKKEKTLGKGTREEKRKNQSPNERQTSKVHNAQWGALTKRRFLFVSLAT
jgi:hypothetical protein